MTSVLIVTPCYGQIAPQYVTSLLGTLCDLGAHGISWSVGQDPHNSFIVHARNKLTKEFLESGADYMFSWDADVEPTNHGYLSTLIASGLDCVGGVYPRKVTHWDQVHSAASRGAPQESLAYTATKLTVNRTQNAAQRVVNGHNYYEMDSLPAGFTLYSRKCVETVCAAAPTYTTDDGKVYSSAFAFDSANGRLIGEDVWFCQQYKKLGGTCWALDGCDLIHHGAHGYRGLLV